MDFKNLNMLQYPSVGRCIYCGSTKDLTREHIIAFGLGGTGVLPNSSCKSCAAITGKLERILLRGPMWPVRIYRKLNSRSKHSKAPKLYPVTLVIDNVEQRVDLPIDEYPILLTFPVFTPPACYDPDGYTNGIRFKAWMTVSFGPKPEEVMKRFGATKIDLRTDCQPSEFARVIAKIAYATAYAEGEIQKLKGDIPVLTSILGKDEEIGRWVGTITDPIKRHQGKLHQVLLHRDENKGFLIGEVHLFCDSETPSYGVVLGRL